MFRTPLMFILKPLQAIVGFARRFVGAFQDQMLRHMSIICIRNGGAQDHPVPMRAKAGDAGFDLYCNEDKILQPQEEASISQGIRCKFPNGCVGMVVPRSSANKMGLHVKLGTIDSGYTGQMFALVQNFSDKPVEIKRGMRICQCLPIMLYKVPNSMYEVDAMPETERGQTGFGSTGKDSISASAGQD